MRILIVPNVFPSTVLPNKGIFILRRVQALRNLGHEVAVWRAIPAAPPFGAKWDGYRLPEWDEIDGISVHTVRTPIPPRMIGMEFVPLFLRRALAREIDRFKPDIVHASFLLPCGQLVVQQKRVPSIVTGHGVDAYHWPNLRPGLRRACTQAVSQADAVTAVSGFIAECLRKLAPRDVRVIWNGGDERYFYPRDKRESRAALDLPQDRTVLAFAGTQNAAKGLYDLLEALKRLPPERRPIAAIAGGGPEESRIRAAYAGAGVDARFFGTIDSSQIGLLFGAADAVTLPSHAEGLPNVVCEAMLSQRAVVASTVGGIPEIVSDGRTGLLVPPKAPEELSHALDRALNDDALRDTLAENARSFAQQHLTWRVSASGYAALYQEVLERQRVPQASQLHIPSAAP